MNWTLVYLPEAEKDLRALDGSQQLLVRKALRRVVQNPLPVSEGGYGKPLGNHSGRNLTGLLKIKLKDSGLRVVYQLRRTETAMLVVVVGLRSDEEVYDLAARRMKQQ
jgi:mRNA interferase RelE/StbE